MHPTEPTPPRRPHISEVRTTVPDRAAAEAIARRLVEQRLAACVQIDGALDSVYRWKDAIDASVEWRLTAKTSLERTDACIESILSQHTYDLPEIIVSEVGASRGYADWVIESTSP